MNTSLRNLLRIGPIHRIHSRDSLALHVTALRRQHLVYAELDAQQGWRLRPEGIETWAVDGLCFLSNSDSSCDFLRDYVSHHAPLVTVLFGYSEDTELLTMLHESSWSHALDGNIVQWIVA